MTIEKCEIYLIHIIQIHFSISLFKLRRHEHPPQKISFLVLLYINNNIKYTNIIIINNKLMKSSM